MNSQEYRRWRQKRHLDWIELNRPRKHPDSEAERLIEFAGMWAPYGGAAKEDIFINFGMTVHRFVERLWQVIPESTCEHDEIYSLACAYPHQAHGVSPFRLRRS